MPFPRALLLVVLASLAWTIAACGGDDSEPGGAGAAAEQAAPAEDAAEDDAAALGHIHGLGIDPRDGTLFIATHNGLFSAADGATAIERVGESEQDIMGFSVVGADRFIGSGHPGPSQDLPPNLGLIESRDGGRTWRNVSLLGEADFHVLQSGGGRIYGFDGTQGRLMVSRDGGRKWTQQAPPAGLFDLAIHPEQPDRIIASTERGIFSSDDGGKEWRPVNSQVAGLLAWPSAGSLYLVDGQGQVQRSTDGGRRFQPTGRVGGQPVAFMSDGEDLYVALGDGSVQRSTDGGAGWTLRAGA